MSHSSESDDESIPKPRLKHNHEDERLYKHILTTRKDAIHGGPITRRTTLVNIMPATSNLVKDLAGVMKPAVPCQLKDTTGKLYPRKLSTAHDCTHGYRLSFTYDKLLLAPVARIVCEFVEKNASGTEPYLVLVVEHHFNACDGYEGIAGTYKMSDPVGSLGRVLTYTANGATCSGFNRIAAHQSRFGPEETEIVSYLRALLETDQLHEIKFRLFDGLLSTAERDRLNEVRKLLPGGSGVLLPTIGVCEYAAFRSPAGDFRFDRKHIKSLEDTLIGSCKDPMVPLPCVDTFSTVAEAVVQLTQSAIVMDAESREQLRLWAAVAHKATLFMAKEFPVLAVNFKPFKKLGGDATDGNYKLPRDLECQMSFKLGKCPAYPRKATGHLLSTSPGLPHHDAFFRIAGPKQGPQNIWEKYAYDPDAGTPRWEYVNLQPHYNSFTFSSQLATATQLTHERNSQWRPILLNQRHDKIEDVDPTSWSKASAAVKAKADGFLTNCKPWNAEQLEVIEGVKKAKGMMSIVMGPAGTGKTTLHKALTLYFWILGFHVLSLAPANSNANQVANGMSLADLQRDFPGYDFSGFTLLRLFPSSKEVGADKAKHTTHKQVGHKDGNVLSFNELLFGLDEHDSVQGTAKRFSVIHTMIDTADANVAKLKLRSGRDAWALLRELFAMYRKKEPMPTVMGPYEIAFRACKRHIIGRNRFMITTTGNVRAGELMESWFQEGYGVNRIGVVIFVDEAAKDLEINVWSGIVCEAWSDAVRGVWLFGDEMQLKPTNTSLRGGSVQFNAYIDRPDIALPCRLIREGIPFYQLKQQRRMHPCLSKFPNREVYSGELRDGPELDRSLDDIKPGFKKMIIDVISEHGYHTDAERAQYRERATDEDARLHWIEVKGTREKHPSGTSKCVLEHVQIFFAKIMPALLAYYSDKEEKMADDIMIICAYGWAVKQYEKGFQDLIKTRRNLSRADFPSLSEMPQHITLDSSQGQEAFMVIFDGSFQEGDWIGFMQDRSRCNVAFTRAKEVFMIIGGPMKLKYSANDSLVTKYKRELEAAGKVHKFN